MCKGYRRAGDTKFCLGLLSFFTYQDFPEVVVRDIGELRTVELGDHELLQTIQPYC
jgi:hypothetical protein